MAAVLARIMSLSERDKAALRNARARSILEYKDEMAALIEREQERQTRIRKEFKLPDPTLPTPAWEIAGAIAELLARLADGTADLDDDEMSADIHLMRCRLTKVGAKLGRSRNRG